MTDRYMSAKSSCNQSSSTIQYLLPSLPMVLITNSWLFLDIPFHVQVSLMQISALTLVLLKPTGL